MRHRLSQFFVVAALTLAANAGATTPSKDPDESKCLALIWVRFTGQIQAAQIVKSTSSPRLDEACIKAVLNQSMKPGSRDGILVDTWVTLPIVWKLKDSKGHSIPPAVHDSTVRPIPILAGDQALNLDPPYDPRSPAINALRRFVACMREFRPTALSRVCVLNTPADLLRSTKRAWMRSTRRTLPPR